MARLRQDAKLCLGAFAPRKYGLIAKVRVKEGHLTLIAWAVKKLVEMSREEKMPKLVADEPSPDVGRRKEPRPTR